MKLIVLLVSSLIIAVSCIGCGGAFKYVVLDSIEETAKDVDKDYGKGTVYHATKKRIRCGVCEADGVLDDGTICKTCEGKGYTYEFE